MALRVKRSALLLAALFLSACEAGGGGGGFLSSYSSRPAGQTQTGTQTVKQRVSQLRADQTALAAGLTAQQAQLNAARAQVSADAQAYNAMVGAITTRLYAGTTPANPELVGNWNEAQAKLDSVTVGVGQLNSLASQVTTQASVAGYLLDNVRATYSVGGAVDEDHRQLRAIEDETSRSIQTTDRLIADLNSEIVRQNAFLARERTNLASLSYGVNVGRMGSPPGGGGSRVTTTPRRSATARAPQPTQISNR
jgi:outer membrane murein-binding lipoprotein Lpp